jgi:hypothetical protein
MSESAAGQSAGNAGSQGESTQSQQAPAQTEGVTEGKTEGAQGGGQPAGEGGESIQQSFDKAGTDTMNHETKEVVGDDDYRPVKDYIREKYKDDGLDDDDKADRKAYRHIKDLETYQQKNREANQKVMTLFNAHPELVGALQDMDEGADFTEALALNLDAEQRKVLREVVLADDYIPKNEKWAEQKKQREQQFTDRQKWTESYAENRKIAAQNLREFAEENKLDQAGLEEFAKYADQILADVYNGKVDKGFLNALHRARTADSQIQQASKVAEVKGRNEAIKEKVTKATPTGDGLPDLSKGGETKPVPKADEGTRMITNLVDGYNRQHERFK